MIWVGSYGVVILFLFFLGHRYTEFMDRINKQRQRHGALAYESFPALIRRRHYRLLQTLRHGTGFLLYLRNFSAEVENPWRVSRRSVHWTDGISEADLYPRDLERKIFQTVQSNLIHVMLCNDNDSTPPDGVLSVRVASDDWVSVVTALIYAASTVIIYASEISDGLLTELDICESLAKSSRKLFVESESILDVLSNRGVITSRFETFVTSPGHDWARYNYGDTTAAT